MKLINASTRTLVDFPPSGEAVPVYFLYEGKRIRIDRVLEKKAERKAFNSCITYKCEYQGKVMELRWDKEKDRWYIQKI